VTGDFGSRFIEPSFSSIARTKFVLGVVQLENSPAI